MFLSPGKVTSRIAVKTDLKRKKDKDTEDTAEYKKRRALKKVDSKNNQESSAVKEGITYETDVDINNNTDDSIRNTPSSHQTPSNTHCSCAVYICIL